MRAPLMASLLLASPQSIKLLCNMSDQLLCIFVTHLPVCVPVACAKWNAEKLLTFWSLSTIDDSKTNIVAGTVLTIACFLLMSKREQEVGCIDRKTNILDVSPDIQTSRIIRRNI